MVVARYLEEKTEVVLIYAEAVRNFDGAEIMFNA